MTTKATLDTALDNVDLHIYHQCDLKCEDSVRNIFSVAIQGCLQSRAVTLEPLACCSGHNIFSIGNRRKVVCQMFRQKIFHVFENEMKDSID